MNRFRLGIYEELGVRPIINAGGTFTYLGGSMMEPEVLAAMNDAAKHFVDMAELAKRAGEIVAEITGAGAGLVTSGAAASLAFAAAGCMTGMDPAKVARLPDTTGMKNEIVVQRKHRNPHDHHLRVTGVKLVEVGDMFRTSSWEVEAAINERTAALVYFIYDPMPGTLSLEKNIELAHAHNLPIIVDAAAEVPPFENLRNFTDMGVDLVAFSGGKAILGPNDTGILIGRKDLIEASSMNAFPEDYPKPFGAFGIGRTMKVSKEQIVGLVVALKRYAKRDHKADMNRWKKMAEFMARELNVIPNMKASVVILEQNPRPICIPKIEVSIDERASGMSASELVKRLITEEPRIAVVHWPSYHRSIYLNPQCLLDGEEKIVVNRIKSILSP